MKHFLTVAANDPVYEACSPPPRNPRWLVLAVVFSLGFCSGFAVLFFN